MSTSTIQSRRRERNGRLSRAGEYAIEAVTPGTVKRLRDAALAGMRHPEWGTELGRLFLHAKITPAQYEAGKRFARLYEAAKQAMMAVGIPAASSFVERMRGQMPDPASVDGVRIALREREILMDWDDTKVTIKILDNPHVSRAMTDTCIKDRYCDDIACLKVGLNALCLRWKL